MTETNVFELTQPGAFSDPLTEVLRNGARTLLGQAVEAEVAAWLSTHTDKLTDDGRRRLVRHGHLPEREIVTGIGAVAVRCPRVRDRVGEGGEHIRFSSTILPPYARRSKSLEVLIPILYLKGISTGDFEEALIALLGKDAGGLSASTIGRLKEAWSDEHTRWSKRDLSAKRYVYFWVDGIHVQARLEEAAQCLLVIIGATPEGKKELVELIDGVRESAQSWKELLLDLKRRGLAMGPELAVADGALGFWQAIEEVWPRTRGQPACGICCQPQGVQSEAGALGEEIKDAVENKHLHAGALKIVVRLARMDAVKRDDFWRSLQLYWDYGIEGGLFGAQHVGDLVEQARDASGDGTTELAFVLCGIPPMNRSVLSTVSVGSGHSLMAPE